MWWYCWAWRNYRKATTYTLCHGLETVISWQKVCKIPSSLMCSALTFSSDCIIHLCPLQFSCQHNCFVRPLLKSKQGTESISKEDNREKKQKKTKKNNKPTKKPQLYATKYKVKNVFLGRISSRMSLWATPQAVMLTYLMAGKSCGGVGIP